MTAHQFAQIEIRQNFIQSMTVFLFSLVLGVIVQLGHHGYQRIQTLFVSEDWNADLAIIPKGTGLGDLRRTMLDGKTEVFLPEALFDTTVGLAKGEFQLNAVLAITDEKGARVLTKGQRDLGTRWLNGRQNLADWSEQVVYRNPDWGTKVISAFFAAGSRTAMQSLKDLIDRKSVAQAIWIGQQNQRDQAIQKQAESGLILVEVLFIVLVFFGFLVSALWMRWRLQQSFQFLVGICGFPSSLSTKITLLLTVYLMLVPLGIGLLLARGITGQF